ncbi:MAG: hypothetical protein N2560_00065 [Ignavibacteria bacterium]|nr:hypothetical protein [Ignavibacteria bacterium]
MRLLFGNDDKIVSVKFSKDGKYLATASYDSKIIIWDANSFSKKLEIISTIDKFNYSGLVSIDFSPDSRYIASGSNRGNVILWDAFSGRQVQILPSPNFSVYNVEFSPNGKYLAVSLLNSQVMFIILKTGR